jgi:Holliday junction resolvase RusA-like endonuclease
MSIKKQRTRKIILSITPQTHVRTTQGDKVFFRIPRERLRPAGLKRLLRIERYNNYKIALSAEAKRMRFSMQPQGMSIHFFLPVPRTWSKKQKKLHHFQYHTSRPDLDNLLKAFKDSLISEDKGIAHYEVSKWWVDNEVGWIEIHSFEPEPLDFSQDQACASGE